MPAKQPKNLNDLREKLFQRCWNWWRRRGLIVKSLMVLLALVAIFLCARAGSFGNAPQAAARAIPPRHIPYVDPPAVRPALTMTFDSVRDGSRVAGRNDGIYRSGDEIVLNVTLGSDAWTLIVGTDNRGQHPVLGRDFRPVLLQGGRTHEARFLLDHTLGPERYLAIAAAEPFTFERDVLPALRRTANKGPLVPDLPLNDRFAQQAIWFTHIAP